MESPVTADPAIQEIIEPPKGYKLQSMTGREALKTPGFVEQIASIWAEAYKQSPVSAQKDDPKYDPERQQDRVAEITKALNTDSAKIVYATSEDDGYTLPVGFFWGGSLADLKKENPEKAAQVGKFTLEDPEKVAYLSMLGVTNTRSGVRHGGRGLGKFLTEELCRKFKESGYKQVVARTINPKAWKNIYEPLHFESYGTITDPHNGAERIIFGKKI